MEHVTADRLTKLSANAAAARREFVISFDSNKVTAKMITKKSVIIFAKW